MLGRNKKNNLSNFPSNSLNDLNVNELETGYALFSSTFAPNKTTSKISRASHNLAAITYAFSQSTISVNGQPADARHSVAAYFTTGGRILFDLNDLTIKQQNEFWNLLFLDEKNLSFRLSSHRISGVTATGNPAEISLKPKKNLFKYPLHNILVLYNTISQLFTRSQSGMNIAVGGEGTSIKDCKGEVVANDGRNGHVLISTRRGLLHSWFHWLPGSTYFLSRTGNAFMIGIENSAPGKKNIRTKKDHGLMATKSNISAFALPKMGSKVLADLEKTKTGAALSGENEGYNVITAKVTANTLNALTIAQNRLRNPNDPSFVQTIVNTPPQSAIHIQHSVSRINNMKKYQETTLKTSHTLQWSTFGAMCLAGIGIGICFIPGFQPLGILLTCLGLKVSLSLAATLSITGIAGGIMGACAGTLAHKARQSIKESNYKESIKIEKNHSQSLPARLSKRPPQIIITTHKNPSFILEKKELSPINSRSILSILTSPATSPLHNQSPSDMNSLSDLKNSPISKKIIIPGPHSPTRTPTDLTSYNSFSNTSPDVSIESDLTSNIPHVSSQQTIYSSNEDDLSPRLGF
ncbi:MAG: hypothetical protein JO131_05735 [Gammaproteobacteria bacterium]|nr:hypothetical protein [Gammaproteobacteria bacterium]